MIKENIKTRFYEQSFDVEENRMFILLKGIWVHASDIIDYLDNLKKMAQELKPGYTSLVDLTQLKMPSQECLEVIEEAINIAIETGIKKEADLMRKEDYTIAEFEIKQVYKDRTYIRKGFIDRDEALKWLDED